MIKNLSVAHYLQLNNFIQLNALNLNLNNTIVNALIIDDEIDICYLLSSILKKNNFKTTFVNKINDAVFSLKGNMPSIVFLDNHLPDGKGIDFIEYIKINCPHTKIVMISAHDSFLEKQKAIQNGADLFLSKPFSTAIINKAISSLFN